MSKSINTRLTELNARLDKVVQFKTKDEDESAVKTGAKVAGVGALAAGGLYLRGRMGAGKGAPNVGVLPTIKGGANLVKSDVGAVASKVGALTAKAGAGLNQVGRNVKASALRAPGAVRDAWKKSYVGKVKAMTGVK